MKLKREERKLAWAKLIWIALALGVVLFLLCGCTRDVISPTGNECRRELADCEIVFDYGAGAVIIHNYNNVTAKVHIWRSVDGEFGEYITLIDAGVGRQKSYVERVEFGPGDWIKILIKMEGEEWYDKFELG